MWELKLEIVGVGIACTLANLTCFLSLLILTNRIPEIEQAIQWPNAQSIRGLGEYFSLALPSAMMLCLEWWAFEVMTLLTGYIGVNEQASQIIMYNIIALMFMFSLGM